MSSWKINFGATAEGEVVLMLEPLSHGRAESMFLTLRSAESLQQNLTQAITEARNQKETQN
jgi:hypothetical protein